MVTDRVGGGDPRRTPGRRVEHHLSGQDHEGDPGRAGQPCQRTHHLAVQRLIVEPALTGDHQVGRLEVGRQSGALGDQRRPRLPAPAQRQQREPQSAGRTRAGEVANRAAGRALQLVGPRQHPALQGRDGVLVGPLLRPEHVRRAGRAEQPMLDIRRGDQPNPVQPRRRRPGAAEGLDHAAAAVGAGAASQTDDHGPRTRVESRLDELADTAAVRGDRGLCGGRTTQQGQTAGLGGLDVGHSPVSHSPVSSGPGPGRVGVTGVEDPVGIDLGIQRAAHPAVPQQRTAAARGQHLQEARAAIGLGRQRHRVAGPAQPPARRYRRGGLSGGERVPEAIRGDQHVHAAHSNLAGVKLLGRNKDEGEPTAAPTAEPDPPEMSAPAGTTAPKGRPTPKRSSSSRRRGPVAPAPTTVSEARKRRKEMRRTMTRAERRDAKQQQRTAMAHRRERMLAGEEAFLLPRDQGPVRRYVRDLVDSRRSVLGLFMPSAMFLIFVMLGLPPRLQYLISMFMLVFMTAMAIDAVVLARKVKAAVDEKFPGNTETRFKLGLYAIGRATQLRRMRIPRPQVDRGATVG